MDDLKKQMRPDNIVSKKMRALLDKEKIAARKRIVERGIVHFRADAEFMEALLSAADRSKVAPGTLCRRIVWDYLQSRKPSAGVAEKVAEYTTDHDALMEKLQEIQDLLEQSPIRSKTRKKAAKPARPADGPK